MISHLNAKLIISTLETEQRIPQTTIHTGKRTEWSPIQSVIIRVITTSDDREAGVRFVNHEYDYRLTSDDTKSTCQLIIKITIFKKHKK